MSVKAEDRRLWSQHKSRYIKQGEKQETAVIYLVLQSYKKFCIKVSWFKGHLRGQTHWTPAASPADSSRAALGPTCTGDKLLHCFGQCLVCGEVPWGWAAAFHESLNQAHSLDASTSLSKNSFMAIWHCLTTSVTWPSSSSRELQGHSQRPVRNRSKSSCCLVWGFLGLWSQFNFVKTFEALKRLAETHNSHQANFLYFILC